MIWSSDQKGLAWQHAQSARAPKDLLENDFEGSVPARGAVRGRQPDSTGAVALPKIPQTKTQTKRKF